MKTNTGLYFIVKRCKEHEQKFYTQKNQFSSYYQKKCITVSKHLTLDTFSCQRRSDALRRK